jgi:hypothetical protein
LFGDFWVRGVRERVGFEGWAGAEAWEPGDLEDFGGFVEGVSVLRKGLLLDGYGDKGGGVPY